MGNSRSRDRLTSSNIAEIRLRDSLNFLKDLGNEESEIDTWKEHGIEFDSDSREKSLELLKNIEDNQELIVTHKSPKYLSVGLSYTHWFISTGDYIIEFGSGDLSKIYKSIVSIRKETEFGEQVTRVKMDKEVRARIRHVLGMSNFSFCLRNSEHVVNYIAHKEWISYQAGQDGKIVESFRMNVDKKRMVNRFPSNLQPNFENEPPVYNFLNGTKIFTPTGIEYYLDLNDNTHNILLIGPTGAGKSNLINVIFNRSMCKSEASHRSVSRDVHFFRGKGMIYNHSKRTEEEKEIVIADTIGLCDTEVNDDQVFNCIKKRISKNFKYIDTVILVFKADRLLQTHVANLNRTLDWLKYREGSNRLRFLIIVTHAEFENEEKEKKLRTEVMDLFKFDESSCPSIIYTGFMPQDFLNVQTMLRVVKDFRKLNDLIKKPGNTNRILFNNSLCTIL